MLPHKEAGTHSQKPFLKQKNTAFDSTKDSSAIVDRSCSLLISTEKKNRRSAAEKEATQQNSPRAADIFKDQDEEHKDSSKHEADPETAVLAANEVQIYKNALEEVVTQNEELAAQLSAANWRIQELEQLVSALKQAQARDHAKLID